MQATSPRLPAAPTRWLRTVEALVVLALTLPAALLTRQPSLWFLIPFAVIILTRRDSADYGLDLSAWRRWGSVRFHVLTITVVFVPYVIGHYLLARWSGGHFVLRLPPDFAWLVIDQVLGIALPEEFFFRGYLQSQLNQTFGRPWLLFGVRWGVGLPVAALLFALCHLPLGGVAQLSVFFPGLLYGWLRERGDTVVVPAAYHAFSNLLLRTMLLSLG